MIQGLQQHDVIIGAGIRYAGQRHREHRRRRLVVGHCGQDVTGHQVDQRHVAGGHRVRGPGLQHRIAGRHVEGQRLKPVEAGVVYQGPRLGGFAAVAIGVRDLRVAVRRIADPGR